MLLKITFEVGNKSWVCRCIMSSACFFLSLVLFSASQADCYEYDSLGRLINVKYDATFSTSPKSESIYELDEHGNRVTVQTAAGSNVSCLEPDGIATSGVDEPLTSDDYDSGTDQGGGPNQSPVTDNESYSMLTNSTITVSPLEGDSDPEGGVLTLVSVTDGSPLVSATKSGNQVIIQSSGIEGSAGLTYLVSDPLGLIAAGSIQVTVTSSNSEPDPDPDGPPDILMCGDVLC